MRTAVLRGRRHGRSSSALGIYNGAMNQRATVPRYAPERTLPPYSYVPGLFPHPFSDPRGHSFAQPLQAPESFDPAAWNESREFLYAIDLFNHGYYWEAHETWEALWKAAGRRGVTADFLKALIKLAAAGVKAREGRPSGVQRHARRAAELLQLTQSALDGPSQQYCGLDLEQLRSHAKFLAARPDLLANDLHGTDARATDPQAAVQVLFPWQLRPE